MDKQLSIFDLTNNNFEDNVNNILTEIMAEKELPAESLRLISNISLKGDDIGKEKSKTICICEPDYPINPNKKLDYTIRRILKIEQLGNIELLIRDIQLEIISPPSSATVNKKKSDKDFTRIVFNENDLSIYPYIKSNIMYSLSRYTSKNSFSCCSNFIACSDAKKCVHVNKLYATGCYYKMNLDSGKIFYGKNKNISDWS